MKNFTYLFLVLLLASACNSDSTDSPSTSSSTTPFDDTNLFQLLEGGKTGISFDNHIEETLELNTINNDAIVQGAGLGIIDVNNDNLPDIYFAGNMVEDQLYLNNGDFTFTNISKEAGIAGDKDWSTGVAIVDINNDGYQDIYVCKFLYNDAKRRKNKLYINNKDNTFTEKGEAYGLADDGFSVMANFFDYDLDGDLDVYVANQPPSEKKLRKALKPTDFQYTDRLYRNDGNEKFTDVTEQVGVKNVCYSLSATVSDFNNDGLPDMYVASDYEEPDLLYQNNGDGTFTNIANEALKHMSNFSMGADIADINNDGYMDVFTADMVAEDNFRNKTNMSSMAVEKFWGLVNMGYHYQFMFNSLQLNNGNGTFSEIAQMAGVSKTDWSWSSLFVDANQDGYKDLFVTNGIMLEIRNKDYINKRKKFIEGKQKDAAAKGVKVKFDPLELSKMAPSVKIKNQAFANSGDLQFDKKTDHWGFGKPGWSQGMAYADFDNDGDLDLVVNNMNDAADVYKNQINDRKGNHYLAVTASGMPQNTQALNARVKIEYGDGQTQLGDLTPYRGYMSSCQNIAHFGLGGHNNLNKVTVTFSDGKVWSQNNVKADQTLQVKYSEAAANNQSKKAMATYFATKNNPQAITYTENPFNDYAREVLIPYKMSNLGPTVAVGDVNNDGNDDFYIGGAVGQPGKLYLQSDDGTFTHSPQELLEGDKIYEDGGAVFVDVDLNGFLDLYVASGGNEYDAGSDGYQDRLYINTGDGNFLKTTAIPEVRTSTAVICTLDYDKDGDLDFFVGGRQKPGAYGRRVNSMLFENTRSSLVDVTAEKAFEFENLGMVTGATWVDLDGDQQEELVVVGEWMAVTIFKWQNGEFVKTENESLKNTKGLWNTIASADVDGDGDMDLVTGNYGLNYKYKASVEAPFSLYVNDFDENGTNDVYLGYYDETDGGLYPVRGRQCSSEQMPFVKEKFKNYDAFGKATVTDVLEGKMEGCGVEQCHTFAHLVLLNDGKGNFTSQELPRLAQVAPVYDMVIKDFNKDQKMDILFVGNFHQREVETTRSDAGVGTLLIGDGKGGFTPVNPAETGVVADRDARVAQLLKNKNNQATLIIGNNGSEMQFYGMNR